MIETPDGRQPSGTESESERERGDGEPARDLSEAETWVEAARWNGAADPKRPHR